MKEKAIGNSDYAVFVTELKRRILSARFSATRAVNRDLILLYWDIGHGIVERQKTLGWGDSIIETLAKDLQKIFPGTSGFSAQNLWRMRQFYIVHISTDFLAHVAREIKTFNATNLPAFLSQAVKELENSTPKTNQSGILSQAVRELLAAVPWGHHANLLTHIKDPAARFYYLMASARFGWSRNVLLNQIKAQTYERVKAEKKTHNFKLALPEHLAEQAQEALKSRYNLEFLGISRIARERELEGLLIERLKDFILELGYGFCFIGRQHRLVLGNKEYFIDLLFYHRFLKALVAVELKIGAFEPEFTGKMDFYLNLLNEKERAPADAPSIGIILCAEKDNLEVEFALKTKLNPIGVAQYQLTGKLPRELKGKLPTERELRRALLQEGF